MEAIPTVLIRPFEASDQASVRRLILDGLGERFGLIDESVNLDLEDINTTYLVPGHAFLVAVSAGTIVGTGGLLLESEQLGRIVRMSVSANFRRQGVGTSLIHSLLEVAEAHELSTVEVRTEPHWSSALNLYTKFGFQQFGADEVDVYLRFEC